MPMKRIFSCILMLALVFSIVPAAPASAWNMPFGAPPVIDDPAFQFPALFNDDVVLNKTQGRLPALGWNSWNAFGSSINEGRIRGVADAFVSRGLDKAGYEYVVIDDGCYPTGRVNGRLTNNSAFSSGFRAMSDYVHDLGLKFGMYNDVGVVTCAGQAGLYGYEDADAQSFADWDIDYIKVDYCGYPWDIGYQSAVAPNQQYVYAPRIRSITLSGGGLTSPITVNAASGGIPINGPEVSASGNYVGRIGTDMNKYVSQFYTNQSVYTPFWRELGFNLSVPSDGTYDLVINYSTGNPARYTDETSVAVSTVGTRLGRWLQVAVGPEDDETRFFDNALPQTDFGTTQTYTYIDSPVIKVGLKSGENLLRLMNHRREEDALYSYAAFVDGLNKAGVGDKVVLSVCDWGQNRPYHWAYKVGDSWRTSDDLQLGSTSWGSGATPSTSSIMGAYAKNVVLFDYAGLNRGWNDPDMMVIGMNNINSTMAKSHMALWCMMNSPIMLGFDLTNDALWEANKDVVLNTDFLALNQDPLGVQSRRVYTSLALSTGDPSTEFILNCNRIDVVAKPLANGDVALTFVNCGSGTNGNKSASVDADTIIKYIGDAMADGDGNAFKNAGRYIVTDLWTKESSINTTGTFSATNLGITDTLTIRITPVSREVLGQLIAEAQAARLEKMSGANPIIPANDALLAGVEDARAVYDNASATDTEIQSAIVALRNQFAEFKDAYAQQESLASTIKRAGKALTDNAEAMKYITVRNAAAILKTAIASAETSYSNQNLDKAALIAAGDTLNAAIDAFKTVVAEATSTKLMSPWYVVNPQQSNVKLNSATSLAVTTVNGDFYQISPTTTNRVNNIHIFDIPNKTGDIVVECEMNFSPTTNYQTAGIMFYLDEYNLCSVVRRYHSGATPYNCFMSFRNTRTGSTGAATSSEARYTDAAVSTQKCYLRIVKNGATITGYYREEGRAEWRQASAYTGNTTLNNASTISVGLYAANGSGSASSIPATFENFKVDGVLYPFANDFVKDIPDIDTSTPVGTAPELPAKVTADFSDGTTKQLDVVWDAITPDKYGAAGVFDVIGTVAEANVIVVAHVTVFGTSVNVVPGDDKAGAGYVIVANGKNVDYLLIMATYNRNGLITDIVSKAGSVSAAGLWKTDSLEIDLPRGYTAKAFIWDAGTFVPLCGCGEYEEPWEVDKSALLAAITAAGSINTDAYTRVSEYALKSALAESEAVFDDENATRPMVRIAKDSLEDAIMNLELPPMVKLTGTYYGTPGTYGSNRTFDLMFDGNISTFFDAPTGYGDSAWAGVDLGAGNETYIYGFRFYPRPDSMANRINNCTLRGSMTEQSGNVGTLLHQIGGVEAIQWYSVDSGVKDRKFRYVWIQSGPGWWGNCSELEFYGKDLSKADLSLMSDRAAFADSLTSADYSPESWAKLQTELAAAKLLTTASPQATVDSAAAGLIDALAQLSPV